MDSQLTQPTIPLIRIESSSSIEKISATPPPPHDDVFFKALRGHLLQATAGGETATLSQFKVAFTSQEFLHLLFRLLDEDGDQLIDQDWLVARLRSRLTGEKEAHLADVLTTAIHAHAFDQLIGIHIFVRIFKTKELLDRVFRVIDLDGDGVVSCTQIMEFIANLTNAKPRTSLTAENLVHLERLFRETTRGGDEIHLEDFRKIVKSKNIFFTERVFKVFDRDGSGTVSLQEFLDAITKFSGQSPDDKINFLFRIYDLDGDGLIQHNELRHVMNACMEENGMRFSDDQIDDLTTALFEDADPNYTGAITFEALKAQLAKHQGLLENLSTSIERWLVPPQPENKKRSLADRWRALLPHWMHWRFVRNNYVYLGFLTFFVAVNVALFVFRVYQFRESNGFYILARASGFCLNFTCMMLLVFMLRNLLTWLRSHGASAYLPLDEHIHFHKLTGILVAVYSAIHTAMHVANFHILAAGPPSSSVVDVTTPPPIITYVNESLRISFGNSGQSLTEQNSSEESTEAGIVASNPTFTVVEWMFTAKPGKFGLVPGWAAITGDLLVLVLLIMVLCSMRCVRKNGKFEVFYWTHQLFVVFWILLILHAPNFWKWFVGPAAIYIVERIVRFIRVGTGHGRTIITEGVLLPSRVTHLVIKRPQSFIYHPGDYIFVRIPAIARSEWHPFTLSSAPEQEDFLWLHIRAVGEWTNRLYDYVETQRQRMSGYDNVLCTPALQRVTTVSNSSLQPPNGIPSKYAAPSPVGSTTAMPLLDVPHKSVRIMETSNTGYDNLSFESETNLDSSNIGPAMPSAGSPSPARLLRARPLHKPLTVSRSMPDVEARVKEREKRFRDREHSRSASEKAFDEQTLRRAREIQANSGSRLGDGLTCTTVYRRHRDSMAQSFKYLRHKPMTIQLSPVPEPRNGDHTEPDEESAITPAKAPSIRKKSLPPQQDTIGILNTSAVMGKPLEVYVDGPFGAPSSHIFRAQHAVLVATGIGVTPFASILQSIMRRYWAERHTCPQCSYSWTGDIPRSVMNLKKVDFFWINRDQRSFEWFVNLLSQLEIEQAELGGAMERFLDMHMYITSALQRADMKALGLQLALDLLHEREKRDLITGLKTRTQAGRPNWNKVFKQIADQKKGKVTVFYCGPPELGRMLQVRCDEFGFTFRKEVF